ncbi:HEAT repeat domain-containing protein [Lamprocystis purpurea]|uniref:HEAT repeat domain-containing protein n=1 Tax=Lamprocystis purpurea TaxID=61598 RepID=UPI0012FA3BF2|nr:HEAT repeat domain-containing protein [Lamprocystis purpurea]
MLAEFLGLVVPVIAYFAERLWLVAGIFFLIFLAIFFYFRRVQPEHANENDFYFSIDNGLTSRGPVPHSSLSSWASTARIPSNTMIRKNESEEWRRLDGSIATINQLTGESSKQGGESVPATHSGLRTRDVALTFDEIIARINRGTLTPSEKSKLIFFCFEKLETGSPIDRVGAASCLGYLPSVGDNDAIAKLVSALNKEEDLEVVQQIIWALRALEARAAVPRLEALFNDSKYDPLRERIEGAIRYLRGA